MASGPQAEEGRRRAAEAVFVAVTEARRQRDRAVDGSAGEHIAQLAFAWASLLAEVRTAGDPPSDEQVARADTLRMLHLDLLGPGLHKDARVFTDTQIPPDKAELSLALTEQRAMRPAGPARRDIQGDTASRAERLRWLSQELPYLAVVSAPGLRK